MSRALYSIVLCTLFGLAAAAPSSAAQFDCGQPVSPGDSPLTSDALAILRAATGQPIAHCSGRYFCVCDVSGNGAITASDALLDLRHAVGLLDPGLDCVPDCPPDRAACTSATFTFVDSELDQGWTGISHDQSWPRGGSFSARIKRECSGNSAECETGEDCNGNGTCEPTCDCGDDVTCELTGPTHEKHCVNNLEPCATNADCDPSIPCVHLLGPPLPLSTGGTPICIVNVFDAPLTGALDSDSGHLDLSTALRARVALGIAIDRPCPRCGPPHQNPDIGDEFTCEGGQTNGLACTVDAVSETLGGTSYDCPPDQSFGVSGSILTIPLRSLTTRPTTHTAQLPCKAFGFTRNPLVPGSNPKCIDKQTADDPVCTSNADCRRCTGDVTIACTSDTDCTGNGTCAEAPEQPVTCGYWCHCGFCNQNPSLPCFETSDCPDSQTCQAGTGAANTPTMGQQRPNDCSSDGFLCGSGDVAEQCETTSKSSCSEMPYRTCDSDEDCENFDAGFCNFEPRPCFESRITRSGVPSPVGTYCAFEDKTCTTNADCTLEGDFCVDDSARPEMAALFCMPATTSPPVNAANGITGPAALGLTSFVRICRCGDGDVGCDEQCDDGNRDNGDGCDEVCEDE